MSFKMKPGLKPTEARLRACQVALHKLVAKYPDVTILVLHGVNYCTTTNFRLMEKTRGDLIMKDAAVHVTDCVFTANVSKKVLEKM